MYHRLAARLLSRATFKALWKMSWNLGLGGALSVEKHKRRIKRGEFFPPFLYVSIINSCNLRCQGCWVDVAHPQQTIDLAAMNRLIAEAKSMGNRFFGLVGGEPFMHPELFEIIEGHPDCYFQVFTNGQFITPEKARRLAKAGNVTPLISVEGKEVVSDERRGRSGVFSKTMRGVQNCLDAKVVTGVCTSVCKSNLDLVDETWLDCLIEMGVLYTWFHVYRPMGPAAHDDLCLSPADQKRLRQFVVTMRAKKPIAIIDAYYDGAGNALCPAATGISHHINPWGDIEPCPIVQFSKEAIHGETDRHGSDTRPLREKFIQSEYLSDFRALAQTTTRGCIVLERPDLLQLLVEKHSAKDSTARQTAAAELATMTVRTSQYHPGDEVPEVAWPYRLAKRFWFSDFGLYAGHDHSATAAPGLLAHQASGVASAPRGEGYGDALGGPTPPRSPLVELTLK